MRTTAVGLGAGLLAVASVLVAMPASAVPSAPSVRSGFDQDPFEISGSRGSASGSVEWSRSGDSRTIRGSLSGDVNSSSGCATLQISWLNSAYTTIGSTSRGCSGDISASFSSPALQCVRIRLLVRGDQTGPTKLLCAGGT